MAHNMNPLLLLLFSTQDSPCSGRPQTVTTTKIVEKIYKLVLNDRLKLLEVADTVGISTERTYYMLTEMWGMSKSCRKKLFRKSMRKYEGGSSLQCHLNGTV